MGWVMGNEHPCLVVGIPSLEPTARHPKIGFPKKKHFPTSDFQVQAMLVSGRVHFWGTFLLASTTIEGLEHVNMFQNFIVSSSQHHPQALLACIWF